MARATKQQEDGGGYNRSAPLLVVVTLMLVVGLVSFSKPNVTMQQAISSARLSGMIASTVGSFAAETEPWVGELARPGVGTPWPGTPMELPTKETFDRLQANPSLSQKDAALAEFEAAPWLLPPRTKALSYAGVHELDKLLQLRSTPQGKYNKTITLMTYTLPFTVLMQNTIYTMVKFGGVRNYIVGTWTKRDLEACADLNLPCADVSAFLPEPLEAPEGDVPARFGTHDYLVICWLRSAIIHHLLKEGYVVYNTDSDVVYTMKPAWQSYLAFIEHGRVDGAFQAEYLSVNGGNYVVLPTPGVLAMFEQWTAMSADMIKRNEHDQQGLDRLNNRAWKRCTGAKPCAAARDELDQTHQIIALFRAFQPGYYPYIDDICTLSRPHLAPMFDTCDWQILFLHPLCANYQQKLDIFKQQLLWFLDDEKCLPSGESKVLACQLLRWRDPDVELHVYSCPSYGLGLQHERRQFRKSFSPPPPQQPPNEASQTVAGIGSANATGSEQAQAAAPAAQAAVAGTG